MSNAEELKLDCREHIFIKSNGKQTYKIKQIAGTPKRMELWCPNGITNHQERRYDVEIIEKQRVVHTFCECGLKLATSTYSYLNKKHPVIDEFYYEELDKDFNWVFKNRGEHE